MTIGVVVAFIVVGHVHWAGGLVAFNLWLVWTAWSRRAIRLPIGWQGLLMGVVAIGASTALSSRPSGLAWMGFLQWLSLFGGIFAFQDVLRESERTRAILLWGMLAGGMLDLVLWTQELVVAHLQWWMIRVDGLPLFPMRIRLFGSHGSTQAAAWLGGCILIANFWALPRLSGVWRWLGAGFLVWCSLLMGFCDSRLGMAGLLAAVLIAGCERRGTVLLALVSILPNLVWWIRDHVHPSQIAAGGGVRQGGVQLLLAVAIWGIVLAVRKWPEIIPTKRVWRWGLGIGGGVLSTCPIWLPLVAGNREDWATGRLEFWRVGTLTWWESPVFGSGPWTYSWAYAQRHDWLEGFLPMHPHNWLLEVLFAGGLVLLAGFAWTARCVLRDLTSSSVPGRFLALLIAHLVVSMAFDSPLSSPQIQLVVAVVVGLGLSTAATPVVMVLPRTAAFVPLLCLVPLGYVVEGLAGKAALQKAGEAIHAGQWEQGAREILEAYPKNEADLQWTRNALMARTALNLKDQDSLVVLARLWDSQVLREPGFLPNRIHRDFVYLGLGPDLRAQQSLVSGIAAIRRTGWEVSNSGVATGARKADYPTDDPAFWMQRLQDCSRMGCGDSLPWLIHWFEVQTVPGSVAEAQWRKVAGLPVHALRSPSVQESFLYGSVGAGWLLIPQLDGLVMH